MRIGWLISVFVTGIGCGSGSTSSGPDGAVQCQRWSMAHPVAVPGASTGAKEASPTVAGDHGVLAFTSSPSGTSEIYTLDYFGGSAQAVHADALDTGGDQRSPRWNTLGTRLYFSRAGALMSATYADGSFAAPIAEAGLTGETVATMGLSLNELELFYGDNADPTLSKLRYATRTAIGSPWIPAGELGAVNLGGDSAPTLSHDQFTLYWASHRDGHGALYTAVRQQVGAPFASVETFVELPGADADPDLSSHDTVFAYVVSDNVYVATRTCM